MKQLMNKEQNKKILNFEEFVLRESYDSFLSDLSPDSMQVLSSICQLVNGHVHGLGTSKINVVKVFGGIRIKLNRGSYIEVIPERDETPFPDKKYLISVLHHFSKTKGLLNKEKFREFEKQL